MDRVATLFGRYGESGGKRSSGGWWARAVCFAVAALFLVSCEEVGRDPGPEDDIGEQEEQVEQRTSAGPETAVSFLELTRNPEEYYGERVTVSATVARTFESRAVSLVTEEIPENQEPVEDESVLAVGRQAITNVSEGQVVRATGEVRRFSIGGFEEELGVDLKNSLYVAYEDRSAIIADSVVPLQGTNGS